MVANAKRIGRRSGFACNYICLLFISTKNGRSAPSSNKDLVSYCRLHNICVASPQNPSLLLTLSAWIRADINGNLCKYIYPGGCTPVLDIAPSPAPGQVSRPLLLAGYLAHLRHIDFSPTQKSSLPQHG
jgi:hypothetical protein